MSDQAGFVCKVEDINAVEAWLSSLPGHAYANVRTPLVHTLNLAHLMPLSSVWAGPVENRHLAAPPLLQVDFAVEDGMQDPLVQLLLIGRDARGQEELRDLIRLDAARFPAPRSGAGQGPAPGQARGLPQRRRRLVASTR